MKIVRPGVVEAASVSNLTNTSFGETYINWTWIDLVDTDFDQVMDYIDKEFRTDISKGVQFYNSTGFAPNTSHAIHTRTVDITGNVNLTLVHHKAWTKPNVSLVTDALH